MRFLLLFGILSPMFSYSMTIQEGRMVLISACDSAAGAITSTSKDISGEQQDR